MTYTKQPTIDGEGVVYTASFTPDELAFLGASKHDLVRAHQNAIRQMVKEQLFLQAQNPGLRHLGNNRKKLSDAERKRKRKAQQAGRRNARKG